jgi:hypothetical protein
MARHPSKKGTQQFAIMEESDTAGTSKGSSGIPHQSSREEFPHDGHPTQVFHFESKLFLIGTVVDLQQK